MVNIPDCLGTKFEQRLLLKSAEDLLWRFDLVCFMKDFYFPNRYRKPAFSPKSFNPVMFTPLIVTGVLPI